jgi:hypothetical protein
MQLGDEIIAGIERRCEVRPGRVTYTSFIKTPRVAAVNQEEAVEEPEW